MKDDSSFFLVWYCDKSTPRIIYHNTSTVFDDTTIKKSLLFTTLLFVLAVLGFVKIKKDTHQKNNVDDDDGR